MRTLARYRLIAIAALMLVLTSFDAGSVFAQSAPTQGQLIISEFRFRGPDPDGAATSASGASDEFVEIYNNTNVALNISGVTLVSLQSSGNGTTLLATVPANTTIPARGHYLFVNSAASGGYSLSSYAGSNQTFATGISDNTGVALCRTSTLTNCTGGPGVTSSNGTGADRLDAVGFSTGGGSARSFFIEGTGLPSGPAATITDAADQISYVRRIASGLPQDLNTNANDFVLISATGNYTTSSGDTAVILGAPGPQNLTSPIRNTSIAGGLVPGGTPTAVPDRTFSTTPATNAPAGTLVFNRRYTNNTGGTVTRLRFRIIDITTLNSPVSIPSSSTSTQQAILRALDGANAIVTVNGVQLRALTLEQPPTQTTGGGLNSSVVYGTFTTPTQIAPGGTADVQFQVGVQQTGYYRFITGLEASVTPPQTLNRAGVGGRRTF